MLFLSSKNKPLSNANPFPTALPSNNPQKLYSFALPVPLIPFLFNSVQLEFYSNNSIETIFVKLTNNHAIDMFHG